MSWNYRIFKKEIPDGSKDGKTIDHYTIREVYYDQSGKPHLYTEKPILPEAFKKFEDSMPIKDLKWQLENMLKSLGKPILTEKDFDNN